MLNIAQGQAGVHGVVAELITRGHAPYLPVVDTGVDILLAGGVRLQVKTTLRAAKNPRYPADTFLFTLSKAQTIRQQKFVSCAPRTFSEECDFVVLVALEAHRTWIVPAAILDGRWTVAIYAQTQWRDLDLQRIKELAAAGKTYAEIAREVGSNGTTVRRRLAGKESPAREPINLPQYESRWDLIDRCYAALNETTVAVADAATSSATDGVEPSVISAV